MNPVTTVHRTEPAVEIIQPCSEACACFKRLSAGGWLDYGICTNPRSPFRGAPVRIGRECRNYQPNEEEPPAFR